MRGTYAPGIPHPPILHTVRVRGLRFCRLLRPNVKRERAQGRRERGA